MRDAVSPLQGATLSTAAFLKQPAKWKSSVLGNLCFSADAVECHTHTMQTDREIPCLRVPMQRLDAVDSVCDVWHGSAPLTQGQCGAIHYRYDEDVLFGVIALSEALFDGGSDRTPLQQAAESA